MIFPLTLKRKSYFNIYQIFKDIDKINHLYTFKFINSNKKAYNEYKLSFQKIIIEYFVLSPVSSIINTCMYL